MIEVIKMKIEIFVVNTEIVKLNDKIMQYGIDKTKTAKDILILDIERKTIIDSLHAEKLCLTKLFNGLTVIPNCCGYWLNDNNGKIENDFVETWIIYVNDDLTEKLEYETVLRKDIEQKLKDSLTRIKKATQQKSQAYSVDNKIYFI